MHDKEIKAFSLILYHILWLEISQTNFFFAMLEHKCLKIMC